MIVLVSMLAHAEPFVRDDWDEVTLVETAAGGLFDADQAWLHTSRGCLPVHIEHEGTPGLHIQICEATSDEISVTCRSRAAMSTSWLGTNLICSWERPDGAGGGWGTAHGWSGSDTPDLVELTDERAVWRRVVRVEADFASHSREDRPCSPRSLKVLGDEAPADGVRSCDTSTGLMEVEVAVGGSRGVGYSVTVDPTPVDCRRPCPLNEALQAVVDANAALGQTRFARKDGQQIALFADEAACIEAELPATFVPLETSTCQPESPPWRDAP